MWQSPVQEKILIYGISIGIVTMRVNFRDARAPDEASQNGHDADGPPNGAPIRAGAALAAEEWAQVRLATIFDCCKWDAQSRDHSVLANYPLFLQTRHWDLIARDAEPLTTELLAAELEIFGRAELHDELGLPEPIVRAIRGCTAADLPNGRARVMRFDFHFTREGWRISEVNCDVPGGFIEASGFSTLMAEHMSGARTCGDPAGEYARALADAAGPDGLVALVHATWHSDDRQVMEYLVRRLRDNGVRAALGGPDDVQWVGADARWREGPSGPQRLVLARFFPAEWLPVLSPRARWERWFRNSRSALSNPGTALLVQSKRLPLVWDSLRTPLANWRKLLPETRSIREIEGAMSEWVLKPTLGRVGENIAIEGVTDAAKYQKLLREARRNERNWVAQRRFETVAIPTPDGPRYPCIGVFTVNGRTVGAYGRVAAMPIIDDAAQDVAVLLRHDEETK